MALKDFEVFQTLIYTKEFYICIALILLVDVICVIEARRELYASKKCNLKLFTTFAITLVVVAAIITLTYETESYSVEKNLILVQKLDNVSDTKDIELIKVKGEVKAVKYKVFNFESQNEEIKFAESGGFFEKGRYKIVKVTIVTSPDIEEPQLQVYKTRAKPTPIGMGLLTYGREYVFYLNDSAIR